MGWTEMMPAVAGAAEADGGAVLTRESGASGSPELALLKTGGEGPALFLTHGIGGTLRDFQPVLEHIELPHSIHGMPARGTDGVREPLDTIEVMAEAYLEAIKRVQPEGPYFLIGYSLGGLVAFETAQLLLQRGEQVGLLTMVDSYPHLFSLGAKQRVRLLKRLAKRRADAALRLMTGRARARRDRSAARAEGAVSGQTLSPVMSKAMKRVRSSANRALRRYRPRFYDGAIKFVKAEISTNFPDNPAAVWGHLAAEFTVETVPGDHVEMLTRYSERLAAVLMDHVRERGAREAGLRGAESVR